MKAIFTYSAIACATLLIASSAMAMSFTIDDSEGQNSKGGDVSGWDNWFNKPGDMNSTDEHGTPEVESMIISYENNSITSIVVNLEANTTRQYFDSLFINTSYTDGSQQDAWNHYAIDGVSTDSNSNTKYITDGTNSGLDVVQTDGFYSVADNYTYLHAVGGGSRNAYDGVDSKTNKSGIHKVGLAASDHDFEITFINNTITYSFGNDGLALQAGFFVAYAPWCANDVVGGGVPMDPVPEPTTMLLFGTGIAGLASIGRRKIRK